MIDGQAQNSGLIPLAFSVFIECLMRVRFSSPLWEHYYRDTNILYAQLYKVCAVAYFIHVRWALDKYLSAGHGTSITSAKYNKIGIAYFHGVSNVHLHRAIYARTFGGEMEYKSSEYTYSQYSIFKVQLIWRHHLTVSICSFGKLVRRFCQLFRIIH